MNAFVMIEIYAQYNMVRFTATPPLDYMLGRKYANQEHMFGVFDV